MHGDALIFWRLIRARISIIASTFFWLLSPIKYYVKKLRQEITSSIPSKEYVKRCNHDTKWVYQRHLWRWHNSLRSFCSWLKSFLKHFQEISVNAFTIIERSEERPFSLMYRQRLDLNHWNRFFKIASLSLMQKYLLPKTPRVILVM